MRQKKVTGSKWNIVRLKSSKELKRAEAANSKLDPQLVKKFERDVLTATRSLNSIHVSKLGFKDVGTGAAAYQMLTDYDRAAERQYNATFRDMGE